MSTSGSSLRAFAGRFLIALLVGSLLMAGVVAGVNREVGVKLDRIPKIDLTTAPIRPGGANYLLVGSDTRDFVSTELEREAFGDEGDTGGKRSDTIMVVHLEPEAERTFVVSFPRDLWVNIPGHGYAKINAAYDYGPQTVIDTLKTNFDVDINHYIELNFKTFVELVDSLGTVPVYVPYPARDGYTYLDLPNPGCVNLDGEKSLQWVRSRSLEYQDVGTGRWVYADLVPDIGRIARQQEFIRRLAGLAVQQSLANPFTANLVADKVVDGIKADDAFDKESVFALIDAFRTLNPDDQSALQFVTLPWKDGGTKGGQLVLVADMAAAGPVIERLRTFDNTPKPAPAPAEIRVRVVNATGRENLAVAVTNELKDLGFATVEPVENSTERIPGIDVRASAEQAAKGKLLLRYIEPTAQLTMVPASDVDVTIVLGKAFLGIAVPADALQVTPETTAATDPASVGEVPTDVPAVPLDLPPAPTPVQLSNPAPRGTC